MKDALAIVLLCAVYAHAHTYEVTYQSRTTGDKHQAIVEGDTMEDAIRKGRTSEYGEQDGMEAIEVKRIQERYAVEIDGEPYKTADGSAQLRQLLLSFLNQGQRFERITIKTTD